jgi:hypothetical protein
MFRRSHIFLAVVLILAIAIVFIAPSVDLAPTALRAWQAACAFFLAIAAAAQLIAGCVRPTLYSAVVDTTVRARAHCNYMSDLSCVLLC